MSHTHKHEKSSKERPIKYHTRAGLVYATSTVRKSKKQTLQKKQNNHNIVFV